MITIQNPLLQPLAIIEKYDNDSIQEQINGEYKFSFTTYIDEDGKSEYLVDGNIIEVEDQLFNITHHRRTRSNTGATLVSVDCEQVSYDLLLTEWADGFVHAGTPAQLLEMVLAGTGFTVGAVELTGYISVDLAEENVSVRAILMEVAAQSGGEFLFNRYTISLLARRGQPRGVRFSLGKNLRGIIKDVDIRSGERVVGYEIDVLELNSLPEFQGLEYFELGDTVGIDDAELGIDEQQRIVSYAYSPRRRINSKVTISKKIPGITDAVVRLRKTTVVKDKVYNGTRIGPEVGFEAVRSDNMARAVMNATEGVKLQKGNGIGSAWTDVIYLDTEGNGIFSGRVLASSFEGGTIMIGSGDNAFRASDWGIWLGDEVAADAPFSVNVAGKMKAVDGEFQGKITASDINGGVITGALIRTGLFGVFPRAEMSSSDHMFAAYRDVNNYVKIEADLSGAPGMRFIANDINLGAITSYLGHLDIWAATILSLTAPKVQLNKWGNLYSVEDDRTLSEELDHIYTLLDSKADTFHTHSVNIPNHNHGNPANANSGGGTFIVS